jgi:hypothetical protein
VLTFFQTFDEVPLNVQTYGSSDASLIDLITRIADVGRQPTKHPADLLTRDHEKTGQAISTIAAILDRLKQREIDKATVAIAIFPISCQQLML